MPDSTVDHTAGPLPARPAAHAAAADQPAGLHVIRSADAKVVTKNWGEERWLVTEGAPFGFKLIVLTAGQRTSLQYHQRKEEANLILRGAGTLYFAAAPDQPLQQRPLAEGDVVHVRPGTVHRIAATTDITLVEVSTPELDDVVRIADDWNRPGGRIAAEHTSGGTQ